MKKKQIRTAIIILLVVLFAGVGIARLKIEPSGSMAANSASMSDEADASLSQVQPDGSGAASSSAADPSSSAASSSQAPAASTPAAEAPAAAGTPAETKPETPAATKTPDAKPAQQAPAAQPQKPKQPTCTLEIRCDTVTDTSKLENQAPAPYVPANGVILAKTTATFTEGENVFDVLKRVTREKDIQMEFREDALYSGAYIEGINYLYEFDGGTLSGWMYKVNGQFPNYGCSKYIVKDGDEIVWMYTCDLGRDVGDNSTW